jgi:hypothetical protein
MDLDSSDSEGFASLFDGISLAGWHPAPRVYGTVYPGGPHLLDVFDQRGIKRPRGIREARRNLACGRRLHRG